MTSAFLRTSLRPSLRTFRTCRNLSPHVPRSPFMQSRCFSLTPSPRLMGMTGFTQAQLDVREAVAKICANYPDVGILIALAAHPIDQMPGILDGT